MSDSISFLSEHKFTLIWGFLVTLLVFPALVFAFILAFSSKKVVLLKKDLQKYNEDIPSNEASNIEYGNVLGYHIIPSIMLFMMWFNISKNLSK
jgi:hypothetical protein